MLFFNNMVVLLVLAVKEKEDRKFLIEGVAKEVPELKDLSVIVSHASISLVDSNTSFDPPPISSLSFHTVMYLPMP